MASFPKAILTNAGKNMIAQAQLGQELIFTKGKYGDGQLTGSENQQTFTNLISPKLDLPIQDMVNTGNGQTNVTVLIDRTDLLNGFFGRELGLFAKIGESGTEQLFCYTNAGALSDYIPSGDDSTIPYNEFIDIETIIGNASNVSIIVDQTKVYVTRDELNMAVEELEDKIDGIQVFEGSTASVDGKKGLVLQPLKADVGKYLTTEGWKALLLASQAEAEAGTENAKIMTALRVAQAIAANSEIVAQSLTANGYIKFKNGLILQWGFNVNASTTSGITITYPIAHTVFAVPLATNTEYNNRIVVITDQNVTSFLMRFKAGSDSAQAGHGNWISVGY